MYVREAYRKLEAKLNSLKEAGTRHVVVSGNPGLGKSYFALYMLLRQASPPLPLCNAACAPGIENKQPHCSGALSKLFRTGSRRTASSDCFCCVLAGGWGTKL